MQHKDSILSISSCCTVYVMLSVDPNRWSEVFIDLILFF